MGKEGRICELYAGLLYRRGVTGKALMEMSRRLEANPVNSKTRRFDEVKFGYDITDFITVFHKCLAECTPPKERSRVLRRFVDRRKV